MLSREDRILSEILVSRGLVDRERIEACVGARRDPHTSLVDALVDRGEISRDAVKDAAEEARSLDEALVPEFSSGHRLGEFRLLRELGRGGMGIVYEAEQEPLGRRVALKVLPGAAALDDRLAIRFLREARAVSRLTHPGIVPVYTSGRTEGVLYFAMELICGRTLAELASGAPLDAREAARITAEVAHALAHAHGQGLVHRDVKPENILIAPDGSARITDFGLVLEASAGPFTLSRHVLGTPAYISPEQARGESVDARSDVYGLGAVLYFLLAGRAPFAGEVPSLVLARAQTERPASLVQLRPGLSPRLAAICERAMSRDRGARHGSAAELAAELEAYLAGPEEPVPRPAWRGAIPLFAAATALALLLLLVRGLGRGGAVLPAAEERARTRFELVSDSAGRKTALTLSPDGRFLAYSSNADGDVDLYVLDLAQGKTENVTPGEPGEEISPAFSPDGRTIAFVTLGRPSTLRLLDLDTRSVRDLLVRTVSGLAWSADGREVLFTDRMVDPPGVNTAASKLFAVEVATGHVRALTAMYGAQGATSREGSIAFVSPGGGRTDLWLMPAGEGDARRLTDDDAIEWSPVWSASGRELFFGSDRGGRGGLYGVAAAGSAPRLLSPAIFPGPFYMTGATGGGDALFLVQPTQAGRLYRLSFDAEGAVGSVTALPERFLAALSPDCAPDGSQVVFRALTSDEDLAIGGTDGADLRLLTQDAHLDRAPRFSPDGARIAFQSDRGGSMEIWTIRPDGTELQPLTATGEGAGNPVWSPDGKHLAISVEGRGASFVSSTGAAALESFPAFEGRSPFVPWSWSADGRTIAGAADGIVLYGVASRSYRRLTDFGDAPAWLGTRRLLFTTDRALHVVDVRSGESRVLLSFEPARISPRVAPSPDGSSVLVSLAASPQEIWRFDVKE